MYDVGITFHLGIHMSNGHLGCVQLLANGNNAAMNMMYKYMSPCFQFF